MAWIRGFLIVIIGGVPALTLLWFARIPLIGAFSALGDYPLSALTVIAWYTLAAVGAIALWLSSFLPTGPKLVAGLLAGLLAVGPFAYFSIRDWFEGDTGIGGFTGFLVGGPTAVAIILVLAFALRAEGTVAAFRRITQRMSNRKRS